MIGRGPLTVVATKGLVLKSKHDLISLAKTRAWRTVVKTSGSNL